MARCSRNQPGTVSRDPVRAYPWPRCPYASTRGTYCWPTRWIRTNWPSATPERGCAGQRRGYVRRPRRGDLRRLIEQIELIEFAGHCTRTAAGPHARHGGLLVGVGRTQRSTPVLGWLGVLDHSDGALGQPVFAIEFLDGAVEVLHFDRPVALI